MPDAEGAGEPPALLDEVTVARVRKNERLRIGTTFSASAAGLRFAFSSSALVKPVPARAVIVELAGTVGDGLLFSASDGNSFSAGASAPGLSPSAGGMKATSPSGLTENSAERAWIVKPGVADQDVAVVVHLGEEAAVAIARPHLAGHAQRLLADEGDVAAGIDHAALDDLLAAGGLRTSCGALRSKRDLLAGDRR